MKKKILLCCGDITVSALLGESPTARAIWNALPLSGEVHTWGDELYFSIPVEHDYDDTAAEIVEKGALAYWPNGRAFCVFFGPTPVSTGKEIRPAGAVNVVGHVTDGLADVKKILPGSTVLVRQV